MKVTDALAGFNKEKLVELLIRHGDKAVLAIVVLLSCSLAWGGIDALRLKSVSPARQPKAIEQAATMAESHIDRLQSPPQSVRVSPEPLAEKLKPWQSPKLASPAGQQLFDKPLFEELAKRTKPDVLPIEQLEATAGVAVLAVADRPGNPGADQPRGRLTPFVVVTGLVPYGKQVDEYRRRFAETSYPDPKRDAPLWSEFLVERAEVKPGGEENWQRMDLKLLAKKARGEWGGIQPETLPPGIFMPGSGGGPSGGQGQAAASFASYVLPLPKLVDGAWGPETIHSTFLERLKTTRTDRAAAVPARPVPGVPEEQAPARPDFGTGDEQREGSALAGAGPAPGDAMQQDAGQAYRLFRFVDTTVQVGGSYRYRVRLSVWNPNWKLPARHLSDPKLAENDRLASNPSEPSAAVTVPTTMGFLARSLSKADMKRFKAGMLEALVLAESGKTGNYSLRSVITEVGGLVNVDSRLNKPGDVRARGEDTQTNAVVVDVHGRQQDRAEDRAGGRSPLPPEPFEILVMQPDGSFAVASVADSQEVIDRNIATLPVIESPVRPGTPAAPGLKPAPGGQPSSASPF